MKKIIGLICGLLCISAIASAQHVSAGVRIENMPGYYADIYGPHCLEHSTSLHTWGPILYGRDYIKAENQLAWGKTLGILGIGVAISSVFFSMNSRLDLPCLALEPFWLESEFHYGFRDRRR